MRFRRPVSTFCSHVDYTDGEPDRIQIPLSVATGEQAETILRDKPHAVLAKMQGLTDPQAILYGAVFDRQFNEALLKAMLRRRRIKGEKRRYLRDPHSGFSRSVGPRPLQP